MNYDYETLKATFTAREGLLKNMLENIQTQSDSLSLQHYLIVGPRGIGKTHFLRLIYFGIKEKNKYWFLRAPGEAAAPRRWVGGLARRHDRHHEAGGDLSEC